MERERKKRAEREAIKASVHKHRDAAVEQHLRDELQVKQPAGWSWLDAVAIRTTVFLEIVR